MASLKLFRCTNQRCKTGRRRTEPLVFTSEEEDPGCPKCKIRLSDPRFAVIQRMVMVHYDPPSEVPGYGIGFRACDPESPIAAAGGPDGNSDDWIPNPYHGGTGVPEAVTCPACRATEVFRNAPKFDEDARQATLARLGPFMTVR